jgi:hypothetical protein
VRGRDLRSLCGPRDGWGAYYGFILATLNGNERLVVDISRYQQVCLASKNWVWPDASNAFLVLEPIFPDLDVESAMERGYCRHTVNKGRGSPCR